MAIAIWTTIVGLGLGNGIAGAASSAAQEVPLTQTNRGCSGTVIGTPQTETFGFVIINKTASGKLIANVVLVGATPNATYNIRLIQVLPGDPDCTMVDGTLTTDSLGNGNANIQEDVLSSPTSAWVDLNNQADFNKFFDTQVVTFI
jgi:hypothetical protein